MKRKRALRPLPRGRAVLLAVLGLGLSMVGLSCGDGRGGQASTGVTGPESTRGPVSPSESTAPSGDAGAEARLRLLVFSKTAGFRHASIPDGVAAITRLAAERDWLVESTEDGGRFSDAVLGEVDVVVFLNTTGDVLDDAQQGAFERYVRGGGGYVGVHAAADTEYDWPFYGGLVGAYFRDHPAIQVATVHAETGPHPALEGVPPIWPRTDEWYNFRRNPRADVSVLLTVDEGTYQGGTMGTDHPIAWAHTYEGGRAVYTAMGHTSETYADPAFVAHLAGAISWAGDAPPPAR
jgi:type 1 glutamine amidotransferase